MQYSISESTVKLLSEMIEDIEKKIDAMKTRIINERTYQGSDDISEEFKNKPDDMRALMTIKKRLEPFFDIDFDEDYTLKLEILDELNDSQIDLFIYWWEYEVIVDDRFYTHNLIKDDIDHINTMGIDNDSLTDMLNNMVHDTDMQLSFHNFNLSMKLYDDEIYLTCVDKLMLSIINLVSASRLIQQRTKILSSSLKTCI